MSEAPRRARGGLGRSLDAIKRANAPLAPEDSVALRAVTCLAVVAGLVACESVGELSLEATLAAAGAISVGMAFSYLTRRRPLPMVKVLLAVAVTVVFVDFVLHVLGRAEAGNLASVEGPLAVLFVWIQVTHSFDVPARRDLLFSIVASAAFVAVASAQAIETSFLTIVAIWLVLCVVALTLSWRSMTGAASPFPYGTIAAFSGLAALLAAILVVALPAPHPSKLITLPSSITSRLSLPDAGGLVGGSSGTSPAEPASAGGALGVGGYSGFADSLDTALRADLGDEVVMRVRATRPDYLEALTYDEWSGTTWTNRDVAGALVPIGGGSPFYVSGMQPVGSAPAAGSPWARQRLYTNAHSCYAVAGDGAAAGSQDIQTVYVTESLPNVVIAAPDPTQVWFPSSSLYIDLEDGSIRSPIAITPGTVYTVVSLSTQRSPALLARDTAPVSAFAADDPCDLQLPHPYPTVEALARRITAHDPTVYSKIEALEAWMSTHVRYSTDIPP
ncbi:MAG TPA: transglutaminaseTgpA domain-containing protein, partial [Acidimicrobiales bacterium]|nr:transglutaminaseTgpA domain-containing protein [Acidimicrobiales bacterium]